MKTLYTLIFVLLAGTAYGQSNLPACKGSDDSKWSNCYGKVTKTDYIYLGDFLNGKEHGFGTQNIMHPQFKGDKYVGEFKFGKADGQGIYTSANGVKYVGEQKDNNYHGRGIFYSADGSIKQSGIYKDGMLVTSQYIDPNSFTIVSNLFSNKNPSNQTNTEVDKGAASYGKACFGPDNNYKKIQYPDGSTAEVERGLVGNDNCGCRLKLGSISYVLDSIYLNSTDEMSPEISKIYKAYAPFYGCPDNADYSKIAQILKAKEDQEAKAKAEEKNAKDERIRNGIEYLSNLNKNFCKGTPRTRLSFFEYLGSNFRTHPDDIKLKRVEPSEKYLGCIAVYYSSRGPITCQVVFDDKGVISGIEDKQLAYFRNNVIYGLSFSLANYGCK